MGEATGRDPINYTPPGNLRSNVLNDPEAAAESYREALERNPRETGIISALAAALTRTDQMEAESTWLNGTFRRSYDSTTGEYTPFRHESGGTRPDPSC